ncbi:FecR domain-containing protein [Mesorhizobium sp. ZMM04-5]|uniref:FecR domain-containing protein n=1 Tax=Mesorhizobium marinum TaxID=3228790 RepID=A0ABV3QVZ6_9HYPH
MHLKGLWPASGAVCIFLTVSALAQSNSVGCRAETLHDPERTALTCPNGVRIVAEDGTRFSLVDRTAAEGPEAVRLEGQALMLEVTPGAVEGGFEVITPQAIAAVRGTKWAVDVVNGKTSVFVAEGRVAVSREAGAPVVELGHGDGVDVETGTEPLAVRQWGAARVAALLARFGE